jgi:hypothetical protein
VGAALLAVVLVAVLVLAGLSRAGVGGFCGDDLRISVAAEPEIADHVDALAEDADGCYSFEVAPVSSADLAGRVASREALPDIWVPDSAVRLAQLSRDVQIPFDTVVNSLASTPVVIASRDTPVDMSTWTSALATPGLMMGDPVRDRGRADPRRRVRGGDHAVDRGRTGRVHGDPGAGADEPHGGSPDIARDAGQGGLRGRRDDRDGA